MAKKVIKRVNKKRVFMLFISIILLSLFIYYYINSPTKNVYIINNNIISDNEILELSGLKKYPPYVLTSKSSIKKKLLTNPYIKDVKITKSLDFKFYITIYEYKILGISSDSKLILENGEMVNNTYNLVNYPRLINEVDSSIYDNFIKKFSLIDKDILLNISEILYSPNDVDNERFLLYMDDGNYVYVTLSKIKKLNKYIDICGQLGEEHGIIYLDSGDYIEIKS